MRTRDVAMLVALAAIWGLSFPLTRLASPAFGPLPLVGVRIVVAVLVLLPLVKERAALRKNLGPLFFLGLMNSAIPFALFAFAVLHITSGFTALLNATTPMFGAVLAALVFNEQVTRSRLLGVFVGFLGVATLVWDAVGTRSPHAAYGIAAALCAAFLYAIAATYTKRRLGTLDSTTLAAGSLTGAAIATIPFAVWQWPSVSPTLTQWSCAIFLGLFGTAIAYALYFRLIKNVGVARATTVTFIVPLFGIFWGAIILHEHITWTLLVSCVLVAIGTALAVGVLRLPESKTQEIA
jgi:drug/metabolite transporter (DMT)-like permease